MKIRTGFVSNSSSSSFCIYGAEFSYNCSVTLEQFMEAVVKKLTELEDKALKKYIDAGRDPDDWCDLIYYLQDSDNFNLDHYSDGYDMQCLGRSWKHIGDDETGAQFKQSIQDEINKFMPDANIKCKHLETEDC